jgi:type I restriction enzyme S subunit
MLGFPYSDEDAQLMPHPIAVQYGYNNLDDGPLVKTERSISELGLKNSSAKLVSRGTILIAMYGSIGKLAITQMECCTNQAIAFCKEDGELADKKYLF